MSCENNIKPNMQVDMQNKVSPIYVVVSKVCPYELLKNTKYWHQFEKDGKPRL